MRSVAFHTLGCKVNQYDSQAMLELFEQAGYEVRAFSEPADVYVVNTCTVTGTGDKKSLNAVRRALRTNPAAQVVIAGCLAQRDGEKLLSTGARLVIGNARRHEVVALLEEAVEKGQRLAAVTDILRVPYEPLSITRHEGHTRAVLKIQEGCDRYCTYCIIPYVRGGIRSRKPEEIRSEAQRLSEAGFAELVLTGIHLTSYGRDIPGASLIDAIRACDVAGVKRIRLGSLEPVIVTEQFAAQLQKEKKVCPQFHLALQSGSDSVLRRMRRRYTTAEF
ncbi:MAG: MiaB/RimO family radical SAM methylthiotransferase, partial [Clostridia bacterium]|nr:MiaB/RimO family radical SAM methylthiotransferase [Clostridia bacterium]